MPNDVQLTPELRELCRDTLRFLAADAIDKANSGHPGTAMGAADIAFVMWAEFLRYDPSKPDWKNRDRFVLSGGHASMLLYSLLHLSGYGLEMDELETFRQWGSRTPGHPERGHAPGVEMTTGPLGAGFATAVGMALGSKMMGARFNTEAYPLMDAQVVGICGDGDMEEGLTAEAASLAGHLALDNLIFVYDSNDITIEGRVGLAFSDDTRARFESYGWYVQEIDGHDQPAILDALNAAKAQTARPSLIIAKTVIGAGAPNKHDTSAVHGSPLGAEENAAAKKTAGWDAPPFTVPAEVQALFDSVAARGALARNAWEAMEATWRKADPAAAERWDAHWSMSVPEDLSERLVTALAGKSGATRALSGHAIQALADAMPALVGGSADLEPSTKTAIKGSPSVAAGEFVGRNLHFGIREHAMASVANGMVAFGGFLTYNATFLVFSDYMRPAIRLAALAKIPTAFIFTHDSFFVGEDGPTHQPIEHPWALRMVPELNVWRPADAVETAMAWAHVASRPDGDRPSALLLSRQKVDEVERDAAFENSDVWKGGYIAADASDGSPEVTIIATGSEVGLGQQVRRALESEGTRTRLVSLPCVEVFEAQSSDYQAHVIPPLSARVVIEAGRSAPWRCYSGEGGLVIGIDRFGASAPAAVLAEKFGFTAESVLGRVHEWLEGRAVR